MRYRLFSIIAGAAVLLLLSASVDKAAAATFYLRAEAVQMTLYDGAVVDMWGFAEDTGPGVDDGLVTVPGPRLIVTATDPDLEIVLENNLSVPISLVIPGLPTPMAPVAQGDGRVYSLTHEAAPGGSATYTWSNVRPGAFVYHSASHMQVQVQMGLYGAVTKDFSDHEAYPGVTYEQDALVFYSEIDPAIHSAVAGGTYGAGGGPTSTIKYDPRYYLVNGAANTPFATTNAMPGTDVLFRFVNAGLTTRAPSIRGGHMKWVAEDGFQKTNPRERFNLELTAMKTLDAVYTVPGGIQALMEGVVRESAGLRSVTIADGRNFYSPGTTVSANTGGTSPTPVPTAPGDVLGGVGGANSANSAGGGGGGGCFLSTLD